jgi:hypothetical protein
MFRGQGVAGANLFPSHSQFCQSFSSFVGLMQLREQWHLRVYFLILSQPLSKNQSPLVVRERASL